MSTIQHIRRRIGKDTFGSIEQGQRTFEIGAGNQEIAVGDFITFEEKEADGTLTKRRLTRKVSYVLSTNEVPYLKEEAEKNGLVVLGLVSPIYQTLGSVFANFYVIALGIEIYEEEIGKNPRIEVTEGPHYLPSFVCPPVDPMLLIRGNLKADTWPPGVYSVMLQGHEEDEIMSIIDTLVITFILEEEDDFPKSTIVQIEPLLAGGRVVDLRDREVVPVTPDLIKEHEEEIIVAEQNFHEGEMLFPDDDIIEAFDDGE